MCKVKDIINFCGCTPSQYNNYFNTSRCTLIDLACLSNWKRRAANWGLINQRWGPDEYSISR